MLHSIRKPARHVLTSALAMLILAALSGSTSVNATAASTAQPLPQSQPSRPILLTDPVADPKQAGVRWFASTGHTLRGAFLDYWNKYGGLAQFGYPLTEEFFEEVGTDHKQQQVQYFERNRFELHPENKGTQYEVLLGRLGQDFRAQDAPASPLSNATYFKETGYNLSGAFKSYWDTHGGLFVHGYPITEAAMERSTDGKEYLVQWFERSRFELHPENAGSPYEVLLGVLGRQLSEKKGYPFGWYPPRGHAVDYSWLAGYVNLYLPSWCMFKSCGCSRFQYGEADARVQLNHPDGTQYNFSGRVEGDKFLFVVFGRSARNGEPVYLCPVDSAPVYYVNVLQTNPVQ